MRWFFLFYFLPWILWSSPLSSQLNEGTTFFSYSTAELEAIRLLPISDHILSKENLERWDPFVYQITSQPDLDGQSIRLMAYLYVAQRDFALLSYHLSHKWLGNPDELILKVIHLFYPHFHVPISIQKNSYSEKLSNLVFRKIKSRYRDEEKHLQNYPSKEGSFYWKETPPYKGQKIGTCKPWLLNSIKDVRAPPPPDFQSIIWAYGIKQIRFDQARLTPEQRQLILYWAGKEGPESGNWFAIVNQTLKKKRVPLSQFLLIRAILAMGFTDAFIAAFDSKYTYWVMRPQMRDPSINQIIQLPKHPSYPSAHAVTSAASAVILSYFLPVEKKKWQQLAIQASNTRIWSGLHYLYDNEQGLIQGEKIGRIAIQKVSLRKY